MGENGVLHYIAAWFEQQDGVEAAAPRSHVLRNPAAASERYPLSLTPQEYALHPDAGGEVLRLLYDDVASEKSGAPQRDWSSEGMPFRRITSEGSNDKGDVDGPFTTIEVKNYADPPVSALLNNAEWKAGNAGKPLWFLCYKAAGKGSGSAGSWHVMMTVEELYRGFGVRPLDDLGASEEGFLSRVEQWCEDGEVVDCIFAAPMPGRSMPPRVWRPLIVASDMMSSVPRRREQLWQEHRDGLTPTGMTVPFVLHPRRSPEGLLPVGKWYCYTKLHGACRALESLGVLPQDPSEYDC